MGSALEHQVPEQMFADPDSATKPEGFSTAKALGMAMAQGQKIYTINRSNQTQALQNLRLDSGAMDEIRSSLAAGKEIITHTDQLVIPGYRGGGYAIIDPEIGDGAYKISGGKNGAFLDLIRANPELAVIFSMLIGVFGAVATGLIGALLLVTGLAIVAIAMYEAYQKALAEAKCIMAKDCIMWLFVVGFIAEMAALIAAAIVSGGVVILLVIIGIMAGVGATLGAASACNDTYCRKPPTDDV